MMRLKNVNLLLLSMTIGMVLSISSLSVLAHQSAEIQDRSLYNSGFLMIEIDGDFGDWPANSLWQKVTHNMGWDRPLEDIALPLNDEDGAFEFACVADGGNTDHKLSWSKVELEGNNASFRDPSVFGELRISFTDPQPKKEKIKMKKGKQTKVIEGVDRLQWGQGKENTFIGALTAAMRAIGEDVTYDHLMGLSGAAFRLHFMQPDWCRSSPDATVGFDCSGPVLKALGYSTEVIHSDSEKPDEVKKVREAVVQSIDKGHPVIAIDLVRVPDWGAIVGYGEAGNAFFSCTYYDKNDTYSRAEKWPWVVMTIGEKEDMPNRKESILKSLEIALKIANTEKYGDYASGFAAYEKWAANLLDDSRFEKLDEKALKDMTHVNAWCYNSLVDARAAAVRYLDDIGIYFDDESAAHLTRAAGIYEEALHKLKNGWRYAPFPRQSEDGKRWTKEMRYAQADVLKEVLALEINAVAELKAALDLSF